MPFILILFFVAGLYYGANLIFAASFTLKVHEADLSCIISWGFCFLQRFDLCGDAVKACSLAPLVEDLDLQTFKWWICTGKNALHSSLAGMTRVVCWMFQINKVFFYAVFPRSVYYWILFRPIAASGCHQTNCSTLLIYYHITTSRNMKLWEKSATDEAIGT